MVPEGVLTTHRDRVQTVSKTGWESANCASFSRIWYGNLLYQYCVLFKFCCAFAWEKACGLNVL